MRLFLKIITIAYIFFFAYSSCHPDEKNIPGLWKMVRVTYDNQDVSDEHNPKDNRTILFSSDGKFVSDGDPYGKNSGTYSYQSDTLYLNSAIDGDDSYWTVDHSVDTMVWTGVGTRWHQNFRIFYVRN